LQYFFLFGLIVAVHWMFGAELSSLCSPLELKKVAGNSIDAVHSISRNISEGILSLPLKINAGINQHRHFF
jgi:hypothetical protein